MHLHCRVYLGIVDISKRVTFNTYYNIDKLIDVVIIQYYYRLIL